MAGYIPKMMPRATEMAAAPTVTPGLGMRMVLKDSLPTIILITHDNDIAATAHRVVRISDGRIVADGQREEVGL